MYHVVESCTAISYDVISLILEWCGLWLFQEFILLFIFIEMIETPRHYHTSSFHVILSSCVIIFYNQTSSYFSPLEFFILVISLQPCCIKMSLWWCNSILCIISSSNKLYTLFFYLKNEFGREMFYREINNRNAI